jgi:hypothetical protein
MSMTLLSANILETLHLETTESQDSIGDVGGLVDAVLVKT